MSMNHDHAQHDIPTDDMLEGRKRLSQMAYKLAEAAATVARIARELDEYCAVDGSAPVPIASLGLPNRIRNVLSRARIGTVQQLRNMSDMELRRVRNFGAGSLAAIHQALTDGHYTPRPRVQHMRRIHFSTTEGSGTLCSIYGDMQGLAKTHDWGKVTCGLCKLRQPSGTASALVSTGAGS